MNSNEEFGKTTYCGKATDLGTTRKTFTDEALNNLMTAEYPLFEWLDGTQTYKPYFDIDHRILTSMTADELNTETLEYIKKGTDTLDNMFKKEFNIELTADDYAIETNSRFENSEKNGIKYYGKVSIHIIIPKYKIQGSYLKQVLTETENIDTFEKGLFDAKVYNKNNQKFRVAGFPKAIGANIPKLVGNRPLTDYIVSRVNDANILIEGLASPIVKNIKTKIKKVVKELPPPVVKGSSSKIEELLDIIGVVDDYEVWFNISVAIKNIDEGLKPIWDKWCSRSSRYDCDENSNMWDKFYKGTSSIGTIKHYANLINPKSYKCFIVKDELNAFVYDGTQISASNLFCKIYNKYIKCIDQQKQQFYLYDHDTNIWVSRSITGIYNEVSNVLRDALMELVKMNNERKEDMDDGEEKEELDAVNKKIMGIIKDLSTASWISGVNKFLSGNNTIYDEDFRFKTTEKKDILSVKNGVIELRTGILRPRQYDDYQLGFIDINYDPNADGNEWDLFIRDLFNHPDIKNPDKMVSYIQKLFGYLITKETSSQIMTIANGSGGNGKSVVSNIIQSVFKGNMAKLDESIIDKSQKSNANSATPEIAKLYNKTTAFIEEAEDDLELGKVFKQLVDGGESIARELYGNPFVFQNTAKILMNTNNLPSFKSSHAFLRRIVILEYKNQYAYKDDMVEGDKLRDDNKEGDLLKNKEGIMRWFVDGSIRFYAEGNLCDIPEEMRVAKKALQNSNDWTSTLIFTDNPFDKMTNAEIHEHIDIQSGLKVSSKDLKKILEGKGATSCKVGGHRGYKGLKSTTLCKEDDADAFTEEQF